MNRHNKFRAWSEFNGNKEMLYSDMPKQNYKITPFGVFAVDKHNYQYTSYTLFGKDYPIMQFTGLKDKNGVDIYEGDICRILYTDWPSNTDPNIDIEDYLISISHVGEIAYQAPEFGILLLNRYDEMSLAALNYGAHGRITVIGNIYQNPELILKK